VEKLQREERNIITQLDDLVEKFTVKFFEEQASLDEFTLGYWTQQMGEVPQDNILGDENKLKYLEIWVEISSVDTETSYQGCQ
jgi:hypothetical protein